MIFTIGRKSFVKTRIIFLLHRSVIYSPTSATPTPFTAGTGPRPATLIVIPPGRTETTKKRERIVPEFHVSP